MKAILKFAFAVCLASVAGSASIKAQTVELNGLGSSGLFLELGLGANDSAGAINAPCVWSENTNTVQANDTSVSPTAVDKGSAWVAWTKGTGSTASCSTPGTGFQVYAYLSTDSVVGNRCLYNANLSTSKCSISYPASTTTSAGLILGTSAEFGLPATVGTALNSTSAKVNFAGTDIRPEDAEFAITRALTNCGSVVGSSTQYLGLGYKNGGVIDSFFSSSFFNVVNFALPSSFTVTPVGATPIIVAVNDSSTGGTGLHSFSNIASQNLADILDGTSSYTGDVSTIGSTSGLPVYVAIREPLSGTYNTMEFNVPNRVGTSGGSFATSQDAGLNQLSAQRNCTVTSPWPVPSTTTSTVLSNPMNIATVSGGARQRAIGTGQELSEVVANAHGQTLGYGFWSAANFAGFSGSTTTSKYYEVDGIDPLGAAGTIPTTSSQLTNVSLATTADGKYPIWSMLRLVNVGAQNTFVADLAEAAQTYSTGVHLDFVPLDDMEVVRSHFNPPSQSLTLSNGSGSSAFGSNGAADCNTGETGGDVGGVVIGLNTTGLTQLPLTESDETYCLNTNASGQTGSRR